MLEAGPRLGRADLGHLGEDDGVPAVHVGDDASGVRTGHAGLVQETCDGAVAGGLRPALAGGDHVAVRFSCSGGAMSARLPAQPEIASVG